MARGERLQKVLARSGAAPSRRKAEAWIEAGRVTIDGEVAGLGARVSGGSEVRVDGRVVRAPDRTVVLLLNKPRGVVSTASDPQGRPTVMELVPDVPGLHPVGRLDLDSEGLLVLTNDGGLTQRLTHPSFEHVKRYRAWCLEGALTREAVGALRAGVMLEDGPARADRVRSVPGGAEIELHEGRNRQVRRMLQAAGFTVSRLVRTRLAGVDLGELEPGSYRQATARELARLGYDSAQYRGPTRPRVEEP